MQIIFHCNNCDARLEIEADSAGSRVECPTCRTWVVVPRKGIEPGTTLGGFRIVRLLGRGGMGEVFLARQISMDRPVALKILSRAVAGDPGAKEAFIREIRLTARLQHPHLVTAYDAGEDAGVLFMAMAYISGPTLHELVRRRGALEQDEAVAIAYKISGALLYAWHEHKLLHRDIKPGNILMDAKGEPHLSDLGLAQSLLELSSPATQGPLGTANYMSPAQAEGRAATPQDDIYSLGATLYTMVTGQIPYEDRTPEDALRRLREESLPDPRTFHPTLTTGFIETLGHMMARNPRDRYADWDETHRALRALNAGRAPPTFTKKFQMPARAASVRAGRIWAVVIGAVAGLALGFALSQWLAPSRGRPSKPVPAPDEMRSDNTPPDAGPGQRPSDTPQLAGDAASGGEVSAQSESIPSERTDERRARESRQDELAEPMERIRARRANQFFLSLNREAEARAAEGLFREAAQLLRGYEGEWADDTRELRDRAARRMERAARKKENFERLVDDTARALVAGRTDAARWAVIGAWANPESAPDAISLADLQRHVQDAAEMNTRLWNSFLDQVGTDVSIERASGQEENLRIDGVRDGIIRARRILPEGFIFRELTVSDLSHAERLRRLGASKPVSPIERGLSALWAGDWIAAVLAFREVPDPLGSALVNALQPAQP
ncbi:MAG: serine/threonine protein kinase [Kiritimatiellae bacterium]|nr:serine/threonine protein kinase [Kiritimatiellia bacterium]